MDKRRLIALCLTGWVLFVSGGLALATETVLSDARWRAIATVSWCVLFEVIAIAVWYRVSYRQHVENREPGAVIGLVVLGIVAIALPIVSLALLSWYRAP